MLYILNYIQYFNIQNILEQTLKKTFVKQLFVKIGATSTKDIKIVKHEAAWEKKRKKEQVGASFNQKHKKT